jgi:signal transduction histidine kinase/CheY-like chemotaxis protein
VRHISHELRTPLNTAFLGLKLLSSELKASSDPKDMERYDTLCDVNTSCKAAVDILNDLLCFEKLESGILELHKENVVVDSFLKSCLSMFSAHARECGVTMTMTMVTDTDRDDDIPSVSLQPHDSIFADKFKMDQVIRNLISNALKFTPRGGHVTVKAIFVQDSEIESPRNHHDHAGKLLDTPPPIRMKRKIDSFLNIAKNRKLSMIAHVDDGAVADESACAEVRGKLVIVVADTGAGISKENQKRLFTEIVQFNPEKLQAGGGSGLGLWITQEILNLHDGSISVSSDGEGMGSIFTVEMPMIRRPLTASPLAVTIEDEFFTDEIGPDRNWDQDRDRDLLPPETVVEDTVTELADSPQSPFELLIVDDSRLCRKMLQKCLRADGHTCFEAEDGLEAIEMVKKRIDHANGGNGRPFDAVLMDFIMPNMDGPTATKEIKALGYNAPIYGVTGNGE